MAATLNHNVTTILTQELLKVGDNISNAKYISITNTHDNLDAKINLFLNKGPNNYYLKKNYILHFGETIVLNANDNIAFNNATNGSSLRIQVESFNGAAVTVDVIIKI